MPEKFEGGTPPQESKKDSPTNFGEFLPIVERVTGISLQELKKSFKEGWYDEEVGEELLKRLEGSVNEFKEWVDQAEKGGYSTLDEGKSKLADYEAVVEAMKAHQMAEVLKKANPDLCADPVKLEEDFNKHEKQIQEWEKAEDEQSKQAIQVLLILRNAEAYLLGKKIIKGEL